MYLPAVMQSRWITVGHNCGQSSQHRFFFLFCPYHHFLISCDVQALILCSLILTNGTVLIYYKILYLHDR